MPEALDEPPVRASESLQVKLREVWCFHGWSLGLVHLIGLVARPLAYLLEENDCIRKMCYTMQKQVGPVHFEDFSGEQFERLCFAFLVRDPDFTFVEWSGQSGNDDGCSATRGPDQESVGANPAMTPS